MVASFPGVQLVGSGSKWKAEERKSERKEKERGTGEESHFSLFFWAQTTQYESCQKTLRLLSK